jgi:hypothetical protein
MTPPYSIGPGSSFGYPVPGTVGPGPVFNGQYATNVVTDPTVQYMLDDANATQSAYFNFSQNGYGYGDSNLNWYNANIAPVMADAQNTMASVTGMPPAGYPPQGQGGMRSYLPPGAMGGQQQPEAGEGKSGGNSMLLDIGGFAAVGAGIGFFCGGGPVTAAIGAGVGAVVGGIKHFLFG